jgi:hypothetical protein
METVSVTGNHCLPHSKVRQNMNHYRQIPTRNNPRIVAR